ncbi:hypothetical protein D3C72_1986240 [compost metagenome]
MKRHGLGGRVFQLQPVETGHGAHPVHHAGDGRVRPGDGAVDPLVRHQKRAAHFIPAQIQQTRLHRFAILDGRKAIEGGDADGRGGGRHQGDGPGGGRNGEAASIGAETRRVIAALFGEVMMKRAKVAASPCQAVAKGVQ